MITKNAEKLSRIFRRGAVQISLATIGLLATIFNLYLTSRLVPISNSLGAIDYRVTAIEMRNKSYDPLLERFYKMESDIEHIKDIVNHIDVMLDASVNN